MNLETNCGSCKHWMPPSERSDFITVVEYDYDLLSREVQHAASQRTEEDDKLFGVCGKIKLGRNISMDDPTPLAVTMDGSEYKADLYTQAEFGCRLWEAAQDQGEIWGMVVGRGVKTPLELRGSMGLEG